VGRGELGGRPWAGAHLGIGRWRWLDDDLDHEVGGVMPHGIERHQLGVEHLGRRRLAEHLNGGGGQATSTIEEMHQGESVFIFTLPLSWIARMQCHLLHLLEIDLGLLHSCPNFQGQL
jgi:hypothetical protein